MWSHGSWKTSYAIEILERLNGSLSNMRVEGLVFGGKTSRITYSDQITAIGKYEHGKCGGADGRWGVTNVLEYLPICKTKILLVEWVLMVSDRVIRSYQRLGRQVIVVHLTQSNATLKQRILARNGGENIWIGYRNKNVWYKKYVEKYKKLYPRIRYIDINTEKNSIKEWVDKIFLHITP